MKLITEEISKVEFITEKVGKCKKCFIEGIFLQGDIKNRNGRMYPMETLAKEVGRYNENFTAKGRALGELGHPDGPTVNLDRVSHKIVSLVQEGNNFKGKARPFAVKFSLYLQTSLARVSIGYILPLRFLISP